MYMYIPYQYMYTFNMHVHLQDIHISAVYIHLGQSLTTHHTNTCITSNQHSNTIVSFIAALLVHVSQIWPLHLQHQSSAPTAGKQCRATLQLPTIQGMSTQQAFNIHVILVSKY